MMKVEYSFHPKLRFKGESGELLFKTRRLSVFKAANSSAETGTITWGQLFSLFGAVFKVFKSAKSEEKPDIAEEAAGLKIQLGGKNEFTSQKLKEEVPGLRSFFKELRIVIKEGLTLFGKKLHWLISSSSSENEGFGQKMERLKNIFGNLLPFKRTQTGK